MPQTIPLSVPIGVMPDGELSATVQAAIAESTANGVRLQAAAPDELPDGFAAGFFIWHGEAKGLIAWEPSTPESVVLETWQMATTDGA